MKKSINFWDALGSTAPKSFSSLSPLLCLANGGFREGLLTAWHAQCCLPMWGREVLLVTCLCIPLFRKASLFQKCWAQLQQPCARGNRQSCSLLFLWRLPLVLEPFSRMKLLYYLNIFHSLWFGCEFGFGFVFFPTCCLLLFPFSIAKILEALGDFSLLMTGHFCLLPWSSWAAACLCSM